MPRCQLGSWIFSREPKPWRSSRHSKTEDVLTTLTLISAKDSNSETALNKFCFTHSCWSSGDDMLISERHLFRSLRNHTDASHDVRPVSGFSILARSCDILGTQGRPDLPPSPHEPRPRTTTAPFGRIKAARPSRPTHVKARQNGEVEDKPVWMELRCKKEESSTSKQIQRVCTFESFEAWKFGIQNMQYCNNAVTWSDSLDIFSPTSGV